MLGKQVSQKAYFKEGLSKSSSGMADPYLKQGLKVSAASK